MRDYRSRTSATGLRHDLAHLLGYSDEVDVDLAVSFGDLDFASRAAVVRVVVAENVRPSTVVRVGLSDAREIRRVGWGDAYLWICENCGRDEWRRYGSCPPCPACRQVNRREESEWSFTRKSRPYV